MIVNLPKKSKDSIDLGVINEASAGVLIGLMNGKPTGFFSFADTEWYFYRCANQECPETDSNGYSLIELVESLINDSVINALDWIPFELSI